MCGVSHDSNTYATQQNQSSGIHFIRNYNLCFLLFYFVFNKLKMSSHLKYFKATEIDEFRECFYLFAKNRESGYITTLDELTVIMRSLGMR